MTPGASLLLAVRLELDRVFATAESWEFQLYRDKFGLFLRLRWYAFSGGPEQGFEQMLEDPRCARVHSGLAQLDRFLRTVEADFRR